MLYRVTQPDGTAREFTAHRGVVRSCPPEWESWARFGSRSLVLRLQMRGAKVEMLSGQDAPSVTDKVR